MADNGAMQSEVEIGGDNVPAKTLLVQTVSRMQGVRLWRLLYDADVQDYVLSFRDEAKSPPRKPIELPPATDRK